MLVAVPRDCQVVARGHSSVVVAAVGRAARARLVAAGLVAAVDEGRRSGLPRCCCSAQLLLGSAAAQFYWHVAVAVAVGGGWWLVVVVVVVAVVVVVVVVYQARTLCLRR